MCETKRLKVGLVYYYLWCETNWNLVVRSTWQRMSVSVWKQKRQILVSVWTMVSQYMRKKWLTFGVILYESVFTMEVSDSWSRYGVLILYTAVIAASLPMHSIHPNECERCLSLVTISVAHWSRSIESNRYRLIQNTIAAWSKGKNKAITGHEQSHGV